jgi:hypothetical protein
LATAGALTIAATPAFGAGTGYGGGGGGGGGTGTTPGAPPGFTTVLTSQTVQPSGGTVSAGGVSVDIPAGTFSVPTEAVLSQGSTSSITGLPAGATGVLAIGISFLQNGTKVTGTFPSPVKVTISNSSVSSADSLYVYDASSGGYIPASQDPDIADISVANGTVSFEITADPYLAVLHTASTASSTVPGATTTTTGVPVLGETLLGGLLIAAGALLALRLRRRTRTAG